LLAFVVELTLAAALALAAVLAVGEGLVLALANPLNASELAAVRTIMAVQRPMPD
jgi:hypothetical protein